MAHPATRHTLETLPPVQGMPQGCAWGLFDKAGARDELGTLNYLTPANLLAARDEVKTGQRVQLDWSMENVEHPGFGRRRLEHKVVDLQPIGCYGFDDEIHVNVQSGSQWDGFKHFAHQAAGKFYNGLSHADILSGKCGGRNGIQHWCEAGGIAGRGVLVDYIGYLEANGLPLPDPTTRYEIPVKEIEDVLRYQGTELRPGDIFIMRTGYVRWHSRATSEQRKACQRRGTYIGVKNDEEMKAWLWNHHFAAVAGDALAFEAYPFQPPVCLHEWLLTMWGTPIGEMWDLEKLSEVCKNEKRWTFFLTSAPLHVQGGVSSTPNAIAML